MKRSASLALSLLAFGTVSLSAQARPGAPAQAAPPAGRPAQGNIVRVRMVMTGTKPQFLPATVNVRQGDIVEFVNESGFPHNVAFEATKIPANAAAVLNNGMPNRMQPLMGPMMTTAGQTYRVNFAGAPAGSYEVYCMPHKAMGMKMTVNVQPSTGRR